MSKSLILNHTEIALKLDRIAWHILEEHHGESKLAVIGLHDRGSILAKLIIERLQKFGDTKIEYSDIHIDKSSPFTNDVILDNSKIIKNTSVILIDDVLNSGKTMSAAIKEIINFHPKTIKVAVLANRDHHKFPVQANFVGISLATTLKEHISFQIKKDEMSVWLN